MTEATPTPRLRLISPDDIDSNPENPRLIFRPEEMETLMVSISKLGIQVPVTVYQDKDRYTLIDGERRWRCAKKLNLKKMPALVQSKPTPLENLLLMYNIHALREQWDYFTIASKLQEVSKLYAKQHGHEPKEAEVSEITGLTRAQVRRCQVLIDLPERYKEDLLNELRLPKPQQKITEDFFIEMERSLQAVTKRLPSFESHIDTIRDALISKYRGGVIEAITDFRQLGKIANAVEKLGLARNRAERALNDVFDPNKRIGIKDVYRQTVEFQYDEQKASRQVEYLNEYIEEILAEDKKGGLDDEFIAQLSHLYERLKKLLEG